jgi:hypothetical protein
MKESCGVWDKLRKQAQVELKQLTLQFRTYDGLIHKAAHAAPDAIEVSAFVLHWHRKRLQTGRS